MLRCYNTQICRGHNITCGIIQCTIENMQAQPSDNTTVTTPVQISIFATLWVQKYIGLTFV